MHPLFPTESPVKLKLVCVCAHQRAVEKENDGIGIRARPCNQWKRVKTGTTLSATAAPMCLSKADGTSLFEGDSYGN